MATFAAIVAAAGKSTRFADRNYKKPFAILGGRAVWLHSVDRFQSRGDVKQTIITVAPEDREEFDRKFGANVAIMGIEIVAGGEHRADSVQRALERVKSDIEFVAVHDAARPCLADKWIEQVFEAAQRSGAAILAAQVAETLKRVDGKKQITATVDRAVVVGRPDAASLPPRAAHRSLRQARQGSRHRRRPARRAARPRRDHRALLAAEPQNHHPRRPQAGRAGAQSAAQAQAGRLSAIPSRATTCFGERRKADLEGGRKRDMIRISGFILCGYDAA